MSWLGGCLPGGSVSKEFACHAGDLGSIPGSGRSSEEGNIYPLQYSWASLVVQLVKGSSCNAGDLGSIPGSGRSSEEGNGNPLQYSCLKNPMNGGAWWATLHGIAKSRTWLNDFTFTFHFLFTHSSVLAWRIPWTVYSPWVAVSQTWLSHFQFLSWSLLSSSVNQDNNYFIVWWWRPKTDLYKVSRFVSVP